MKMLITILLMPMLVGSFSFERQEENRIVVQNYYWAKKGKIEEVYAHRLYASEVRKKQGLAVGRVLLRSDLDSDLAHVIWECEYPSEEAREKDVRLLEESGAFEEVTKKMQTLIYRFERAMYKIK